MSRFSELTFREQAGDILRWLCVLPTMAMAARAAELTSHEIYRLASYGWGQESQFLFWLQILSYCLRSAVALAVGSLVIPRKQLTATFVLAVAALLWSLFTHVLSQPNPGRTNYLHLAAESAGAALVAVWIYRYERQQRSENQASARVAAGTVQADETSSG